MSAYLLMVGGCPVAVVLRAETAWAVARAHGPDGYVLTLPILTGEDVVSEREVRFVEHLP